eukprot:TRINITY_DN8015_c0_g1_i1.p1 TRINITY_DN8015_c0_g1~~TRINITY_DN8015_c0_g1_i1.p1  ORF type:complete len:215 (+),score=47.92 TRINITY_DN8015_c0_g1_i1:22-666(+)
MCIRDRVSTQSTGKLTTETKLPPRYHHASCRIDDTNILVSGGKGTIDPNNSSNLLPYSDIFQYQIKAMPSSSSYSESINYLSIGKDLWLNIFKYLDWKNLQKCDVISKYFWNLSHDQLLWERLYFKENPYAVSLIEKERERREKEGGSYYSTKPNYRQLYIQSMELYQKFLWVKYNHWGRELSQLFWLNSKWSPTPAQPYEETKKDRSSSSFDK